MSSPAPFQSSLQDDDEVSGKRSKFTYAQLRHMAAFSTSCPLRIIALIDLDAFYAQCEMVRLGTPEDQPLACQQW
jgi:DNA polymerase eta